MAKRRSLYVGAKVRIRSGIPFGTGGRTFWRSNSGRVGTIIELEKAGYDGHLTVNVQFDSPDDFGWDDWGSHLDLELVEGVTS